jgi:peptide/nickel transport system permease protein
MPIRAGIDEQQGRTIVASGMGSRIMWLARHPRLTISATVIALLIAVAILAPLLSPYDPNYMDFNLPLSPPSAEHWLGTDQLGRDVLSRLMFGARLSLQISITAVTIAMVVGITAGVVSAYIGGWTETLLMRSADVLLVFPEMVLAIAVAAFLGPSLINIMLVIAIVYAPVFARLSFVVARSVSKAEYVEAQRSVGANSVQIIWRSILPNSWAPLIVQTSLSLGYAILTESGLSFLGVGVPPPAPSWGSQIAEARLTMSQAPLLVLWPSLVIATAILSFNVLGDSLRDVLDPRLKKLR